MKLVYDVGEKIQYGFSCASPLRERWSKVAAAVATKFNPPPSEAVDYSASARVEPIPKLILTELWKDDKARVGNGMKHLANLCFHDDNHNHNNRQANRQAVYEAGGIATVVGAMIKWDQNAAITAEGCRTLHNVTMDNLVYQDSAVKVGALEIVLAAMRRFTNDRYIQRVGCGALHALSKNSLNHAMHLIIELDGMRAMVSCMKAFPDSRRLQMWACFAMEDISRWEMLKDHLVDAGALVALAAAIETYREMETSESLAIQEKARSAMKRLS